MGWPRLLVMVRHAESEGNVLSVEDRPKFDKGAQLYGLTELGYAQARITGEYVRREFAPFEVKYTSYYTRAVQTMQHLVPQGTKWYEDPRLAEAQRGIWHTMTHAEIDQYYPGERVRKTREGLYHYRAPGGENWPDVELRIHSFLGTLARDCSGKSVLIVVHGHWHILFEKLIHHFSAEEAVRRYEQREEVTTEGFRGHMENASVMIYRGYGGSLAGEATYHVPWKGKL